MPVYAKKVMTTDKRWGGRSSQIYSYEPDQLFPLEKRAILVNEIPVPDTVVLCNGCNKNLHPEPGYGYLVYLGKREMAKGEPYDLFCPACLKSYFPKAISVE